MGYKMKGMSFLDGQSPMKKIKASDNKNSLNFGLKLELSGLNFLNK